MFPGRAITLEGEGQLSIAWRVGDELVVRVPKHSFGIDRLRFEVRLLESIGTRLDAAAALPRIVDARLDLPVGRAYVAHRRIPGRILRPGDVASLPRDRIELIGAQVGWFLHELHALDLATIADVPVRTAQQFAADLTVEVETLLCPRIRPHQVAALEAMLGEVAGLPAEPSVLAHTDIGGNIVVDDEGHLGIIDFGSCFATHPAFDVASLSVLGEDLVRSAAAAYPLVGNLRSEAEVVAKSFFLQDALYGARQEDWGYVADMFATTE
jgi:aminoglycoside 2''-phosphotransferase